MHIILQHTVQCTQVSTFLNIYSYLFVININPNPPSAVDIFVSHTYLKKTYLIKMCKFFTEKRLGLSELTVRFFGYVMNVFLNF